MAAAGSTTHSMQVMHRKRAAPMCPSTQPAAGAKSPCGRLVASESMLDDGVGAGRAGFVAQASCQRCVSHSLPETVRWVPSNANVRALQAAQPWAPNSAADEPPRIRQCPHVDAEQLASAAPSHSTSADTHPRTPTGTRVRVPSHACALPMTQAHAHYRSSTLTLKLRHVSARREASTLESH